MSQEARSDKQRSTQQAAVPKGILEEAESGKVIKKEFRKFIQAGKVIWGKTELSWSWNLQRMWKTTGHWEVNVKCPKCKNAFFTKSATCVNGHKCVKGKLALHWSVLAAGHSCETDSSALSWGSVAGAAAFSLLQAVFCSWQILSSKSDSRLKHLLQRAPEYCPEAMVRLARFSSKKAKRCSVGKALLTEISFLNDCVLLTYWVLSWQSTHVLSLVLPG